MSSVTGATQTRICTWDASKAWTAPADAQPSSYATENIFEKLQQLDDEQAKLTSDNSPDNVWGKITLPDGEVVTIYNGGSVESQSQLDIDWDSDGEALRARAIVERYGGTLEVAEPSNSSDPTAGMDIAGLWSSIMGSPTLSERMFSAPDYRIVPDELTAEQDS